MMTPEGTDFMEKYMHFITCNLPAHSHPLTSYRTIFLEVYVCLNNKFQVKSNSL